MTATVPFQVLWRGFWKLNLVLAPLSLLLLGYLGVMAGGGEGLVVVGAMIFLGPAILVAAHVLGGKIVDGALRLVPLARPEVTWLGIVVSAVLVVVAGNVFVDDLHQVKLGNYGLSVIALALDMVGMIAVVSVGGGRLPMQGVSAVLLLIPMTAEAAEAGETRFAAARSAGCHSLDLAAWSHPTRTVMAKRKVALSSAELCGQDKFPVFTVKFPYDPQGVTNSYFHPLYAEMAAANGGWPFAFADPEDNLVITVIPSGRDAVSLEFEAWR